jgi:hypothetical protein
MQARDPFPSSREQLARSVSDIEGQVQDWRSIRATDSSSAAWNRGVIQTRYEEALQLRNVLEETCKRVASDPVRFGVAPDELAARQQFIEQITTRLRNVSIQLSSPPDTVAPAKPTTQDRQKRAGMEDNQRFIDGEIGQQQQQIERQDVDLEEVVEITAKTKVVANMIGEELVESTARLTEVDGKMDRVQGQLDTVLHRMKEFLKKGSTWMWIGCIILTVIVLILLFWVIFVK